LLIVAPLLRADLEHAARLAGHPADPLALVNRQRQRFLTVHILAGAHRRDGDGGVPVVGRADGDDLDVLAVQQLAVVLVDRALALVSGGESFGMAAVDVANKHDAAELAGCVAVGRAFSAHTDRADAQLVVRGSRPGRSGGAYIRAASRRRRPRPGIDDGRARCGEASIRSLRLASSLAACRLARQRRASALAGHGGGRRRCRCQPATPPWPAKVRAAGPPAGPTMEPAGSLAKPLRRQHNGILSDVLRADCRAEPLFTLGRASLHRRRIALT